MTLTEQEGEWRDEGREEKEKRVRGKREKPEEA